MALGSRFTFTRFQVHLYSVPGSPLLGSKFTLSRFQVHLCFCSRQRLLRVQEAWSCSCRPWPASTDLNESIASGIEACNGACGQIVTGDGGEIAAELVGRIATTGSFGEQVTRRLPRREQGALYSRRAGTGAR